MGSDLFAASANTYVGHHIPKYWGMVHFGARGGPAQFSVIFARQNEWSDGCGVRMRLGWVPVNIVSNFSNPSDRLSGWGMRGYRALLDPSRVAEIVPPLSRADACCSAELFPSVNKKEMGKEMGGAAQEGGGWGRSNTQPYKLHTRTDTANPK